MKHILVATKRQDACDKIFKCFGSEHKIEVVYDDGLYLDKFQNQQYEFAFIDITFFQELMHREGLNSYKKILQLFWNTFPEASLIVLAPHERIRDVVEIVKAGAGNYLTYPFDTVELKYVIEASLESNRLESELDYFRSKFWQKDSLEIVSTKSPAMQKVYENVMSVAPTKTTVLLTGETGTGKGVIAKLIHAHSNRKDNPFISLHCGAIPDNLVESELFGHEKGSFTGAVRRKLGKFEIARGGTILLDEIGTISPSVQVKLLQVLQEKTFQRVGGDETINCDVRIIAASNADLKKMCDEGLFRNDLYYRLNIFPIEMPTLKKRGEDISLLAEVFLKRLNNLYQKDIHGIHLNVLNAFKKYSWPGNIREMEHLIERAYVVEKGHVLMPESFPIELLTLESSLTPIALNTSLSLSEVRRKALGDIEREYITDVLVKNKGKIYNAAQAAGITTRHLHNLMKKYGIDKKKFK